MSALPASAAARNGLGASLLAKGRVDEAIRELQEMLRIEPAHLNAPWNLSKALACKGALPVEANELTKLLGQKADYADAQAGLAMIYFLQHRYGDALPHFEQATRLRPNDAGIHTNFGALLANQGNFERAAIEFEAVLKIDTNDAAARDYLALAQAQISAKR